MVNSYLMDSLISSFHLDWGLLLAQMFNFAVVLAVLYWLLLKPLFKTVNDRGNKIAQGLADADKAQAKLSKAAGEGRKVINEAKKKAAVILQQAKEQAEARQVEVVNKTKEEVGRIIAAGKVKIHQEKAVVLAEIRQEAAGLVVLATEKLLDNKMDRAADQKFINETLRKKI